MRTLDEEGARRDGRGSSAQRWLIAKDEDGSLEPLTVAGGETLPVFSFEDEAELFLHLAGLGDRWCVRTSGCGEIVSVLYGPCAQVRNVALDPLPEMVTDETLRLVSLERRRFVDHILGGRSG